jgi:ariadne-1
MSNHAVALIANFISTLFLSPFFRCPKAGCGMPVISDPATPMVRCPNTKCRYAFCHNCKTAWHSDVSCAQYQQWKLENENAGDLFEEWKKQHSKACPKCQAPTEKNGGCNHITCTACRHQYCWLCGETYQSGHYALNTQHPCYGKQFS